MSTRDSCLNCAFVHATKDPQIVGKVNHFCRRNPPTVFVVPLQSPQGVHVQIHASHAPIGNPNEDWCGQHAPLVSLFT